MSAEIGHAMRRRRIELNATQHRKRAIAFAQAADRFGSRSMVLFAEAKRLETLERLCRERAQAHTWAAKVSPRRIR